jgi:DNA-binding GntR family transcriptional regulator
MSTAVTRSPRQRERAYLRLREMLLLQQIPEGTRLRETHWAARLSVNRMALREALARLAGEGFITRGADTGYYVPLLTDEDVSEIRRTRLVIECGAIQELCAGDRVSARKMAPLREACADLGHFLQRGYLLGVVEADRRFHERLVEAAGNRRLASLYRRAPLPLIRTADERGERWAEVAQRTLEEHRAIVRALAAGNAAEAMQRLAGHLRERALIPVTMT